MPISAPIFQLGYKMVYASAELVVMREHRANRPTTRSVARGYTPAEPVMREHQANRPTMRSVVREYTPSESVMREHQANRLATRSVPDTDHGKNTVVFNLLADIIAGESSPLYARLYDAGLIDNRFSVTYIGGRLYGTCIFAGYSAEPKRVAERLTAEINRIKLEGIPAERFEIIKQKHIGRQLRSLNSLEEVTVAQIDLHSKQLNIYQLMDILSHIDISDAAEYLHRYFRADNHALSVVWPLEE